MTSTLIIALDRLGRLRTARWSEFGQCEGTDGHRPLLYEANAGTSGVIPNVTFIKQKRTPAQAKP